MTTRGEHGHHAGAYSQLVGLTAQAGRLARAFFLYKIQPFAGRKYHAFRKREWSFRALCTLANALVVLWCFVLYWGERGVFNGAVESCSWEKWEQWEPYANPHRLIFVADPQLIDPHTYPGRPWPLNPLTYKYTDLYLRRTYSRFQTVLYPDTVFFLGDLFDGGREWSTLTTKSPEKQYRKYGDSFWFNEYRRFGDIFFKHWGDGGMNPRQGQAGRKLITSLPGNHDLGFAGGVQMGVRDRFNAYFGDGNRIDIIANHTFVSIDSVSLSALGTDNPQQYGHVWKPTNDFLENVKRKKRRLIQRELRVRKGLRPYPLFSHRHIDCEDLAKAELPHANDDVTEFPTILLSHVPLYRDPGTPCGPLREHWPPTKPPLEHDDRNAISVRGGYQYQNVLNREITADIAEKIGDIRYAFSGDDHDYCEVRHRAYASAGGGIREITVKSISWAMGVRHPGVVLMSMWNPVDSHGKPLSGDASKTVQTHLCLMPDQIGTFLTYATLFGFTLLLLVIRAALVILNLLSPLASLTISPLLPTFHHPHTFSAESEQAQLSYSYDSSPDDGSHHQSANTSTSSELGNLQDGFVQARTRLHSPHSTCSSSKYSIPLVQHAGYSPNAGVEANIKKVRVYGQAREKREKEKMVRRRGLGLLWYEIWTGLTTVLLWGGSVYLFMVWLG